MSIDSRLSRLTPALSATERAILVLRSLKEKTAEDPAWRRTLPRDQARDFNRLIWLMNTCNIYLPLYISVLEQQMEQLCIRFFWWHSVEQLGRCSSDLAALVPVRKRKAAEKAVAASWPIVELPWAEMGHRHSWNALSEQMWDDCRDSLASLWCELRSVELVLDDVAQEFDGEDPLRPIMRSVLERVRGHLTGLHELLSEDERLELPEPNEEEMELAHAYFENGRRLMERI